MSVFTPEYLEYHGKVMSVLGKQTALTQVAGYAIQTHNDELYEWIFKEKEKLEDEYQRLIKTKEEHPISQ